MYVLQTLIIVSLNQLDVFSFVFVTDSFCKITVLSVHLHKLPKTNLVQGHSTF